jgi:hypothetical protein
MGNVIAKSALSFVKYTRELISWLYNLCAKRVLLGDERETHAIFDEQGSL